MTLRPGCGEAQGIIREGFGSALFAQVDLVDRSRWRWRARYLGEMSSNVAALFATYEPDLRGTRDPAAVVQPALAAHTDGITRVAATRGSLPVGFGSHVEQWVGDPERLVLSATMESDVAGWAMIARWSDHDDVPSIVLHEQHGFAISRSGSTFAGITFEGERGYLMRAQRPTPWPPAATPPRDLRETV